MSTIAPYSYWRGKRRVSGMSGSIAHSLLFCYNRFYVISEEIHSYYLRTYGTEGRKTIDEEVGCE